MFNFLMKELGRITFLDNTYDRFEYLLLIV